MEDKKRAKSRQEIQKMKTTVFWDMMPGRLVHSYQHLEESAVSNFTAVQEECSTLKMEAPNFHQSEYHHIPNECSLQD
jgi:hypothetical protein